MLFEAVSVSRDLPPPEVHPLVCLNDRIVPFKKRFRQDCYSPKIRKVMRKNPELKKMCPPMCVKKVEKKDKKKREIRTKIDRRGAVVNNEVTEQMERLITGEMYGIGMKLVIQKKLYSSDLKQSQNRLSMPIKQLQSQDFLTDDEKLALGNEKEIEVRLVGPTLQMYKEPMMLKMWPMNRTYNLVLISKWNHFVEDHKEVLQEGAKIQVWAFRRNQQLFFALAVVGRPDDRMEVA